MDPINDKRSKSADGRAWAEEKPQDVTQKLEAIKDELEAETGIAGKARVAAKPYIQRANELKSIACEQATKAGHALKAKALALVERISQYFKREDKDQIEQH